MTDNISIAFFVTDPRYRALADQLSRQISFFTFMSTGFPFVSEEINIVFLPVERIDYLDFDMLKRLDIPVMAYGKPYFLKKAFLAGCSDYIGIPVTIDELHYRIIHNASKHPRRYMWKDLIITNSCISNRTRKVTLQHQQFLILRHLIRNRNIPVTRESLQYLLWGELKPGSRNVDMHIAVLRKKLCQLNSENKIKTITGLGYMIVDISCG